MRFEKVKVFIHRRRNVSYQSGKISDERFAKMTANYEAEQQVLEKRVTELKSIMTEEKESALNVNHFLSLVRCGHGKAVWGKKFKKL